MVYLQYVVVLNCMRYLMIACFFSLTITAFAGGAEFVDKYQVVLIHDSTLNPIDSGVALPGYVQGQLLRSNSKISISHKSIYLYTLSGKRIGKTETDGKGFFAFALSKGSTDDRYSLVFKSARHKNRRYRYHWHKAKMECGDGEWVDFSTESTRKRRMFAKKKMKGCPRFR